MKTVKDIMTQKVVSVSSERSIVEAVNIMLKHDFNGLPVVDGQGKLVGILTQYDLVAKGSSVYLPTFIKLFSQLDLYKKDKELINNDLKKILNTKVQDVMNLEPLIVSEDTTLLELNKIFSDHHKVNPIPIIDQNQNMVGIVSRSDLIKFFHVPDIKNQPEGIGQRDIDKEVVLFMKSLEDQFTLVSKFRVKFWLVASIAFALVGFIIAWAMIIRIV